MIGLSRAERIGRFGGIFPTVTTTSALLEDQITSGEDQIASLLIFGVILYNLVKFVDGLKWFDLVMVAAVIKATVAYLPWVVVE